MEVSGIDKLTAPPPRKRVVVRLLPIIVVLLWLNVTVLFFEFGPYSYPVTNYPTLYFYLFSAHCALLIGYINGNNLKGANYRGWFSSHQILKFCSYIALAWIVITMTTWLSPEEVFTEYLAGRSDLIRAKLHDSLGGKWQDYVGVFITPFVYILIAAGTYYWVSSSRFVRFTVVATLVVKILTAIMGGGRIGIVETMVLVGASYLAAYCSGRVKPSRLKISIVAGMIFAVFMAYTSFIAVSRSGFDPEEYMDQYVSQGDGVRNKDSIFATLTPPALAPVLFQSIEYVSQGYYPLALCLNKPFVGVTFGLGHSSFLIRYADYLFDTDYFESTSYYTRLLVEDRYSDQLFVTVYPWIANDVTFVGSLFVLFILGYLLAHSWIDALIGKNPLAVAVFALLMFMVFSIPMFSVILDATPFVTFYSILGAWLLTRSRRAVET